MKNPLKILCKFNRHKMGDKKIIGKFQEKIRWIQICSRCDHTIRGSNKQKISIQLIFNGEIFIGD